jgi:hypothetical protein
MSYNIAVLGCYRIVVTMETGVVYIGDFTLHDVGAGSKRCYVRDILVHTDPGQDKPVIIIADGENKELRTYDLSSWQCVSQCTTPDRPVCLYVSDGDAYLQCRDGSLYHILSVRPLTMSKPPHGFVPWADYYNCISHLGPGRLVGVSSNPPRVIHIVDLHGQYISDRTYGEYRFTEPRGVVCAGQRVVVTGRGVGRCLGREWKDRFRVVCLEESAWRVWIFQWIHNVSGYTHTPVIAPGGGTVIVPCGNPDRIISLSLETGAVLQQVDVAPGCPKLGCGTCVYGGSLLVGCGNVVVEFSLQG